MKTEKPKFNSGLILLCTRCKDRLAKRNIEAQDFSITRAFIKSKLKENRIWGAVRACETTCLGNCPVEGSTAFIQNQANQQQVCVVIEPKSSNEDVLQIIEDQLSLDK